LAVIGCGSDGAYGDDVQKWTVSLPFNRAPVSAKLKPFGFIRLVGGNLDRIHGTEIQSLDQRRFQCLLCKRHLFQDRSYRAKFSLETNPLARCQSTSPLRSLTAAGNIPRLLGDYWFSLAAVAGMSWTWLALVAWRVGRTWRDRAKSVGGRRGSGFRQRLRERGSGARVAFRRRRDDKDSYVLRGVGPNGVIDQGKVPSDDWLWSFTTPATNAPAGATIRK